MGKITDLIGMDEVLVQLAEEACELGKAALKYRRTITRLNPTPIGKDEAFENLVEEAADVELCMGEIGLHKDEILCKIYDIMEFKDSRWYKRITNATEIDNKRNENS